MPFAEFQNGNAGLALPQFQAQSMAQSAETAGKMAERASSMMERAQQMRIRDTMLPFQLQQLTQSSEQAALNIERSRMENQVFSAQNSVDMVGKRLDVERKKLEADAATADTTLATQKYSYEMMKRLPQEVDKVLNTLDQLGAGQSSSNVPPMLRRQGAPSSGLQDYETFRQKMNVIQQFKARYGDFITSSHVPALQDVMGRIALHEANARQVYLDRVSYSLPQYMTQIGTAGKLGTSEDPAAINQGMETLMNLQTDPSFHMAMTMNPGLKEAWDKQFGVLEGRQKTVNEQFNAQKKGAADMAVKFTDTPNVVQYQKAAGAVRNLRTIMDELQKSKKENAYEDIAAITELFKILDPTLGLTAQQLDEFQKAGSTVDKAKIWAKSWGFGDRALLTDDMRQKIMRAAESTLAGPRNNYRENQQSLRNAMEATGPGGRQFSKDYQFPDFEKDMPTLSEDRITLSYQGQPITGTRKKIGGVDYLQSQDGKLYPITQ